MTRNALLRSAAIASIVLAQWAMIEPAGAGGGTPQSTYQTVLSYCVTIVQPSQNTFRYVIFGQHTETVTGQPPIISGPGWYYPGPAVADESLLGPAPTLASVINALGGEVACPSAEGQILPTSITPNGELCAMYAPMFYAMTLPPISSSWPSALIPCSSGGQ